MSERSAYSGFFARPWTERLQLLVTEGALTEEQHRALLQGQALLRTAGADRMVENVIGVWGLPLATGLNLTVDGAPVIVPMAVEEPSIVAALSAAAKTLGRAGGVTTEAAESWLAGQIQITHVADAAAACAKVLAAEPALLERARTLQPGMVARGGGPRALTARAVRHPEGDMVVVHLWVDTCDAMGANAVNSLCEALAPEVAKLARGRVGLRILSNLSDRALVTARCHLPLAALTSARAPGEVVRDAVVSAGRFAEVDVHRAVTHNKGIMNGIDAVAVATGNDWRAIEAAAHAYAGLGEGYRPLSVWRVAEDGGLTGTLTLPLKVGIRGGNFIANPAVAAAHTLLNLKSAQQLARIMAAVGLAQNFAALRALGTTGIQAGHMTLHARSVVASAGASGAVFEQAVARLVAGQDIKLERAQSIVAELSAESGAAVTAQPAQAAGAVGEGLGKLIVCGEHAVVYQSHALAVPLNLATRVTIADYAGPGILLSIPAWNISRTLDVAPGPETPNHRLDASLRLIVRALGVAQRAFRMTVDAQVPRAMGLGSSAALAVATVRALSAYHGLNLGEEAVINLAFEAEKLAHGTPSGVDNALAVLGRPLVFRRGTPRPTMTPQSVGKTCHWVVGLTHEQSLTASTVAAVRAAHTQHPAYHEALFAQIDALTQEAARALQKGDLQLLGRLMNLNHGYLHTLGVSTTQLDELVHIARGAGALGAKVTGGGGGGSMLALCADAADQSQVLAAMERAGYAALATKTEVQHAER